MALTIFLDLYGVLADSRRMEIQYNARIAAILHERYGGSLDDWRRIQNESYAWYQAEGAKLDARPGHEREGEPWVEAVRRLNGAQILWVFSKRGLPAPDDPVTYSEDLEAETVRSIDALYPDARPTLDRLKAAGHRIFLSTNANRTNAESALIGGGVRDRFDALLMLETGRAKKDRPFYWKRAFEVPGVVPEEAIVVDDEARYLVPPAELGARCYQMVRAGLIRARGPFPVLASLAALPDLVP